MFGRIRRRKEGEEACRQSAPEIPREVVSAALQANFKPQVIPWNRFSNYNKLLRVFAYILRLLQTHSVFQQTTKFSHPEEYLTAEKRIFILSQNESSPKNSNTYGGIVISRDVAASSSSIPS